PQNHFSSRFFPMSRKRRGRGEGGIFQRKKDGLWVATASLGYRIVDGRRKRKRRTFYGRTKREVQDKLRKQYDTPDIAVETQRLTVETYRARWLDTIKPTVQFGTYKPYRLHVNRHIVPYLGAIEIVKLRPSHVEDLYAHLARNKVSPAMARKIG